ncbi:MAG: GIY-YIG nuclease family protein [Fluviicola sp.]
MATVYIIYSKKIDRFYIGSCKDLDARLDQHNQGVFLHKLSKFNLISSARMKEK